MFRAAGATAKPMNAAPALRVSACATRIVLCALQVILCASLCAASGCATGSFYASNLPSKYKAPPFVASSTADLSRFAVGGSGPDIIAAGDVLEVTVVSGVEAQRPAPWTLRVDASGGLDLPLIGPVRVEGVELTDAERLIREKSIERGIYRNPHVAVVVKDRRKVRVTVVGEVIEPGTYEIPAAQASIVTAIAAAGGMGEKADTKIALRNPSYKADVQLASAEAAADSATPKPDGAGDKTASGAEKVADAEPAKLEESPADTALADAKTKEKGETEASGKLREQNPAKDEKKSPEPEKIAAGEDAKKSEEQVAEGKNEDGSSATAEADGGIKLASAEEEVESAKASTADYVAGSNGEVTIDLLSASGKAVAYPIQDGAVIVVKEKPPRTVQVLGLVKRPDRFEYPDDQELRLLDALALAGGRTMEIADSVKIIRQIPGEPRPVVILASVRYAKQGGEDNLALVPGDVVSVEETPLTFTVDTVRSLLRFGVTTF
ncbi:MAG TPA: SLBB domain-containing protein [Pirellulaceae bacterium]|jgi:protein involved in polysaccharide export with SLBB domain|nr:SLBB domain-containing protein [Pirellulaceae bacterium]